MRNVTIVGDYYVGLGSLKKRPSEEDNLEINILLQAWFPSALAPGTTPFREIFQPLTFCNKITCEAPSPPVPLKSIKLKNVYVQITLESFYP